MLQSDTNPIEQEDIEKDTWEVMSRVLRNSLTRTEVFRDTYSSDCMQWSKTTKSGVSAIKAAYKINWSVGSYGIFIRFRKVNNLTINEILRISATMYATNRFPMGNFARFKLAG